MEHQDEYNEPMVTLLELIWGTGFMAPGGEGNIAKLVEGIDIRNKQVLEIGCGIGGPACVLAGKYGAHVVGTDLEAALIERAKRRAEDLSLVSQTDFLLVESGPLTFPDESFDVVFSSGAFTQIEDKLAMFKEALRVLKPGGIFTCYDWMKPEGEYSEDMRYFFKLEGLTYAMETLDRQGAILEEAGFINIQLQDRSDWYQRKAREEYDRMRFELYPRMVELIGQQEADHYVEDWRVLVVVCDKGEMRQGYFRGQKAE